MSLAMLIAGKLRKNRCICDCGPKVNGLLACGRRCCKVPADMRVAAVRVAERSLVAEVPAWRVGEYRPVAKALSK